MDNIKKYLNKKSELERAKKADLIELPDDLKERCSNCVFITKTGYCTHKKVDQQIQKPDKECCGLWDNPRIDRKRTQGEE